MPQDSRQIDVVYQELADTSAALQQGWRPEEPSAEQRTRTASMRGLIAQRRRFLQAQER